MSSRSGKQGAFLQNILLVGLFLLILAGVLYVIIGKEDSLQGVGELVATADSVKVYESDVTSQLRQLIAPDQPIPGIDVLEKDSLTALVKEVVAKKLLAQAASHELDDVALDQIKKTLLVAREQLLQKAMLAKISNTPITDDAIKVRYANLKNELDGQEKITVRHILLKTEDEAKKMASRASNEKFETLAKKYSLDAPTAGNGGLVGPMIASQLNPVFAKAAFALKEGKVSAPVKTEHGWHVIKLVKREPVDVLPLDKIKPQIIADLRQQKITSYVDGLLKDVDIEIVYEAPAVDEKEAGSDATEGAESSKSN
jgi:parvulin-like peptidyl-prolyl isomerase